MNEEELDAYNGTSQAATQMLPGHYRLDEDIEETHINKMRNPDEVLAAFNLDDEIDSAVGKPAKRANPIKTVYDCSNRAGPKKSSNEAS